MLRLEITTQPALLGLSTRYPRVEVDYHPQSVRIESTPPDLEIEFELPTVEVDASKPRAELGATSPLDFARQLASAGRRAMDEATRRWAQEGDRLARIEEGTDIPELAEERAWPEDRRQLNVDVAPKSLIDVTVHGSLEVEITPGQVDVDVAFEPVSISWRRGAVKSYLVQKASIEIRAVGERFSALG